MLFVEGLQMQVLSMYHIKCIYWRNKDYKTKIQTNIENMKNCIFKYVYEIELNLAFIKKML